MCRRGQSKSSSILVSSSPSQFLREVREGRVGGGGGGREGGGGGGGRCVGCMRPYDRKNVHLLINFKYVLVNQEFNNQFFSICI